MNIFKIALGIILILLGVGLAAAGGAFLAYGTWGMGFNIATGGFFALFGLSAIWSGGRIIFGDRVRDALGGIAPLGPSRRYKPLK